MINDLFKMGGKRKAGFTLVEILVVILIIGLLFVFLVPKIGVASDKAKEAGVKTRFNEFRTSATMVLEEHAGFGKIMTSDNDVLGVVKALNDRLDPGVQFDETSVQGQYCNSKAKDPWNNPYRVHISATSSDGYGTITFISFGPNTYVDHATEFSYSNEGCKYSLSLQYQYGEVKVKDNGFTTSIPDGDEGDEDLTVDTTVSGDMAHIEVNFKCEKDGVLAFDKVGTGSNVTAKVDGVPTPVTIKDGKVVVPVTAGEHEIIITVPKDEQNISNIIFTEGEKAVTVPQPDSKFIGCSVTGTGDYEVGTMATIIAYPGTGYRFDHWERNGVNVSTENPYTFLVVANETYTAIFIENGSGGGSTPDNTTLSNYYNLEEQYDENGNIIGYDITGFSTSCPASAKINVTIPDIIPDGVIAIKGYAFLQDTNIQSVTINSNKIRIDNGAFEGCSNLRTITINSNSQFCYIAGFAFRDCTSLNNVSLPDSMYGVDLGMCDAMFYGCTSLTEISAPSFMRDYESAWKEGCPATVTYR